MNAEKQTLQKILRKREICRKYDTSPKGKYNQLKRNARKEGVAYCTLDEYLKFTENPICYYTGIEIDFSKNPYGYNIDRPGEEAFGGDGKGGGDYLLGNMVLCSFYLNALRAKLDMTTKEFRNMFLLLRTKNITKRKINNFINFFINFFKGGK